MAKLKLPEKAYYDNTGGDGLWHFRWADIPGGPTMVCGRMIHRIARIGIEIKHIDPKDLCSICLGAIEVEE